MADVSRTDFLKPPVYEYELSEDGEVFLCRYKKPCWRLRFGDASTGSM